MKSELEKTIQRRIELAIGALPGVLIHVNPVGRASYFAPDGKPYTVAYGLDGEGSPDLVGSLEIADSGPAVFFAIEVKRPGEEPRPNQLAVHARWRRLGRLVYVAHSVEEALAAISDVRARVDALLGRQGQESAVAS